MRRCVKRESAQRSIDVTNRLPLAISSSSVVSRDGKELYAFSSPETATSYTTDLQVGPDIAEDLAVSVTRMFRSLEVGITVLRERYRP